jgi:hypothetical protein
VFDALTQHEGPAFEFEFGEGDAGVDRGDEQLPRGRHGISGERTKGRSLRRDVTPPQHGELFGLDDGFDRSHRGFGCCWFGRQERHANDVGTGGWKLKVAHGTEEPIGHLDQDASAVAGVFFGTRGPSMIEVVQALETVAHHLVGASAVDVDNKTNATRVVFECGVVETLGGWKIHATSSFTPSHVARRIR